MALLAASDLKGSYSSRRVGGDTPKTAEDSNYLNRSELYEVLPFINKYADKKAITSKAKGLEIEQKILDFNPSEKLTMEEIEAELDNHFN